MNSGTDIDKIIIQLNTRKLQIMVIPYMNTSPVISHCLQFAEKIIFLLIVLISLL